MRLAEDGPKDTLCFNAFLFSSLKRFHKVSQGLHGFGVQDSPKVRKGIPNKSQIEGIAVIRHLGVLGFQDLALAS